MFTGIVEELGRVVSREGSRLRIAATTVLEGSGMGASIAVNGCCLTAVEITPTGFHFEAGPETLRLTNLGDLRPGDRVNLERALAFGDRLGGHLVTGHVDGRGTIVYQHIGAVTQQDLPKLLAMLGQSK